MNRFRTLLALVILGTGSGSAFGQRVSDAFADLPRVEIQVITAGGQHEFKVWIADTARSRVHGLMFVRSLPADQGMLFLFERPQFASFWMKNTYLSLDIVFIGPDGGIVNIARDTEPLSLEPIGSAAPVAAVLELVAGTATRIGLTDGDRVVHPTPSERRPETSGDIY